MLGSIQITRENLTGIDVAEIALSLRSHEVSLLLLRECTITDPDFEKLANALAQCKSIVQLTLNIGIVCSMQRIAILAQVLQLNKSLRRLHLHGSPLGNDGLACLMPGLLIHPTLTDFDVGDCQLGDDAIRDIATLIIEREKRNHPITVLTLSANQDVTAKGWTSLISAVATAKYLRGLFIDYTRQGDYGAGIIAVMLASNRSLQQLDLEDTGITDNGAELILHSLYSFTTSISNFILDENDIQEEILSEIDSCLNHDREEDSTGNDVDDDGDDIPSSTGNGTRSVDLRTAVRFAHLQNEDQSDESDNRSSVNRSYNDTFPSFIQSKQISESEEEDRVRIASKLRLIQKNIDRSDDSLDGNRHHSSAKESRNRQRRRKQSSPIRKSSSESDEDNNNSKRVEAQVHYDSGITKSLHHDKGQNQPAAMEDDASYQSNNDNDDEKRNKNVNQEVNEGQESDSSDNIGQSYENRSVNKVEYRDHPAKQEIQSDSDNDGKKSIEKENDSANNDNGGGSSDSSKNGNKRHKSKGVEISSDDDDDDDGAIQSNIKSDKSKQSDN